MGEEENTFKEKKEEVKSNFQPRSKRRLEVFKLIPQLLDGWQQCHRLACSLGGTGLPGS